MVATKDRPHGPGRSVPMLIVVKCEDHSAIQAPLTRPNVKYLIVNKCLTAIIGKEIQTGAQTKRGPHQYR